MLASNARGGVTGTLSHAGQRVLVQHDKCFINDSQYQLIESLSLPVAIIVS